MRTNYLDYAKAIGILFVIIEHCTAPYSFMMPVTNLILAFHMPLFFVIAGYQYSLKEKITGLSFEFIKRKVKRLLVPYMIFAVCILMYKIPITLIQNRQISKEFIQYIAENILVTGYGVGWFIVTLFYADILFHAAFFIDSKHVQRCLILLSCIAGLLLSFSSNVFLKLVTRVLLACTFLWAGYYAGKYKLLNKLPQWVCGCAFIISVLLSIWNGQCNMLSVSFGISKSLFLYNAVVLSLLFLWIVRKTGKKDYPLLKTIGVHTLIILLTHTYVITVLRRVFYYFLPHNTAGDMISIFVQLAGTCIIEFLMIWLAVKIGNRQKMKSGEMN